MNKANPATPLCTEFVQRVELFQKDGKAYWDATTLAAEEFLFKITHKSNDFFCFTDGTCCEYYFGVWQITKK